MPFERLRALLLADNAIDDWDSVDALNDFPSVAEVRLTGNPVTESAATRHEIVARAWPGSRSSTGASSRTRRGRMRRSGTCDGCSGWSRARRAPRARREGRPRARRLGRRSGAPRLCRRCIPV